MKIDETMQCRWHYFGETLYENFRCYRIWQNYLMYIILDVQMVEVSYFHNTDSSNLATTHW